MSNLRYTRDSVERALDHHKATGAIRGWRITDPAVTSAPSVIIAHSHQPGSAGARYVIELHGADDIELRSLREAWVLVCGLASAGRNSKEAPTS
jgi:hypothetical protein